MMTDEQHELYSRLGAIESKVDILLARDESKDVRLRKVENFEAKSGGIAAVVSMVVAAAVTYIAKHF